MKFKKKDIAGRRITGVARTAVLNVRATRTQYITWRRAADSAGRSLSAWVAAALDDESHGYRRVVAAIARLAPSYEGRVPIATLCVELRAVWAWSEDEVAFALRELAEQERVRLRSTVEVPAPYGFVRHRGPRDANGNLIVDVAITLWPRPRPPRRARSRRLA